MPSTTKRPTMTDIALRVGVSQATVSLVLNNAPGTRIAPGTRERVSAAARELGYQKLRRAGAGGGVIGLLMNELTTTQHVAAFLEGARDEAAQGDCLVTMIATQGDPAIEAAALDHLLARPVVGIIHGTLLTRAVSPPERLREVRTVLLNCHTAGGVLPVRGAGRRRRRLLGDGSPARGRPSPDRDDQWRGMDRGRGDRLQGYRQALATYDIAADPALIVAGGWTLASGREQTRKLLDLRPPPTAIFCFCDRMALGAYEAVRARGLSIPDDVSIVGFDDESFARDLVPPLTTVTLPHEEMARWAVDRLLEDAEPGAGRRFRKTKMECRLVLRQSHAPPRVRR